MNINKESLPTLTVLRYPAAVWVLLLHLHNTLSAYMREPYLQTHPFLMAFVDRGFLGVTFFFVLSGFILGYTYDRSYAQKDFYIARAARVLPVYYFSLLVSLPFLLYTSIKGGALSSLVDGIPVLLLLQAWIPLIAGFWNGPAWTLSCEAFFYTFFPWINGRLVKLAPGSRHPVAKYLVVIATATILGSIVPILAGASGQYAATGIDFYIRGVQHYPAYVHGGEAYTLKMWVEHFPVLRIFEFIAGVATYRLFRASVESRSWTLREARWTLILATLVFAACLLATARLPFVMLFSGLLAPACAAIIFAVATHDRCRHTERRERGALRIGILLGQSSYAVYLLHTPVLAYLMKVFEKAHLIKSASPELAFCVMGAVSCLVITGLSVLVFQWYEEPARHWIKANLSDRMAGQPLLSPALGLDVPGPENRLEL
jgi:peptidoglycan/LPS O-acetylase OafA/YrhL